MPNILAFVTKLSSQGGTDRAVAQLLNGSARLTWLTEIAARWHKVKVVFSKIIRQNYLLQCFKDS